MIILYNGHMIKVINTFCKRRANEMEKFTKVKIGEKYGGE